MDDFPGQPLHRAPRRRALAVLSAVLSLAAFERLGAEPPLVGEYAELQAQGVYLGPLLDDRKAPAIGDYAILAWTVRAGRWDCEDLGGLHMVAVLRRSVVPEDPKARRSHAILYVDERADDSQAAALLSLARQLAGAQLENLLAVRRVPIQAERHSDDRKLEGQAAGDAETGAVLARYEIEGILEFEARGAGAPGGEAAACPCSSNEAADAPPPLASLRGHSHAEPLHGSFRAGALEWRPSLPGPTSAVLGHFEL